MLRTNNSIFAHWQADFPTCCILPFGRKLQKTLSEPTEILLYKLIMSVSSIPARDSLALSQQANSSHCLSLCSSLLLVPACPQLSAVTKPWSLVTGLRAQTHSCWRHHFAEGGSMGQSSQGEQEDPEQAGWGAQACSSGALIQATDGSAHTGGGSRSSQQSALVRDDWGNYQPMHFTINVLGSLHETPTGRLQKSKEVSLIKCLGDLFWLLPSI